MKQQQRTAMYTFLASAMLVMVATSAQAAIKVSSADEKMFLNIGVLLQTRLELNENGAPKAKTTGFDAYARRVRLLFFGQLNDKINFFVETDNPNFGKNGATGVTSYIQDAFLELNLDPMLQIDVGMLLAPFSHMGQESAAALLSTDYHSALMKYPAGSNNVWRDWGLMVRGLLVGKYLEYRLAMFNGVRGNMASTNKTGCPTVNTDGTAGTPMNCTEPTDPRNMNDSPRFVGRLVVNAFDAEGGPGVAGMYTKGIYLKETENGLISPKKFLTLGASLDYQPGVNVTYNTLTAGGAPTRWPAKKEAYMAYAVDLFGDWPVAMDGLLGVTGQFNYYHYNYGTAGALRFTPAGGVQYTGNGFSSELGVRYDKYQIVGSYDMFRADRGPAAAAASTVGDYDAYYGTLVYFMKALQTNFKLEFGAVKNGNATGDAKAVKYAWLQGQLFF